MARLLACFAVKEARPPTARSRFLCALRRGTLICAMPWIRAARDCCTTESPDRVLLSNQPVACLPWRNHDLRAFSVDDRTDRGFLALGGIRRSSLSRGQADDYPCRRPLRSRAGD